MYEQQENQAEWKYPHTPSNWLDVDALSFVKQTFTSANHKCTKTGQPKRNALLFHTMVCKDAFSAEIKEILFREGRWNIPNGNI